MKKNKITNTKGATLIELLVVVTVVIAIPVVIGLGYVAYHFISKYW